MDGGEKFKIEGKGFISFIKWPLLFFALAALMFLFPEYFPRSHSGWRHSGDSAGAFCYKWVGSIFFIVAGIVSVLLSRTVKFIDGNAKTLVERTYAAYFFRRSEKTTDISGAKKVVVKKSAGPEKKGMGWKRPGKAVYRIFLDGGEEIFLKKFSHQFDAFTFARELAEFLKLARHEHIEPQIIESNAAAAEPPSVETAVPEPSVPGKPPRPGLAPPHCRITMERTHENTVFKIPASGAKRSSVSATVNLYLVLLTGINVFLILMITAEIAGYPFRREASSGQALMLEIMVLLLLSLAWTNLYSKNFCPDLLYVSKDGIKVRRPLSLLRIDIPAAEIEEIYLNREKLRGVRMHRDKFQRVIYDEDKTGSSYTALMLVIHGAYARVSTGNGMSHEELEWLKGWLEYILAA